MKVNLKLKNFIQGNAFGNVVCKMTAIFSVTRRHYPCRGIFFFFFFFLKGHLQSFHKACTRFCCVGSWIRATSADVTLNFTIKLNGYQTQQCTLKHEPCSSFLGFIKKLLIFTKYCLWKDAQILSLSSIAQVTTCGRVEVHAPYFGPLLQGFKVTDLSGT